MSFESFVGGQPLEVLDVLFIVAVTLFDESLLILKHFVRFQPSSRLIVILEVSIVKLLSNVSESVNVVIGLPVTPK